MCGVRTGRSAPGLALEFLDTKCSLGLRKVQVFRNLGADLTHQRLQVRTLRGSNQFVAGFPVVRIAQSG